MIIRRVYCMIMIDFLFFFFKRHQQHFSSNSYTVRKMLSCLQIPASVGCRGGAAGGLCSTLIYTQQYTLRQHCHVLPIHAGYQLVKSFTHIINYAIDRLDARVKQLLCPVSRKLFWIQWNQNSTYCPQCQSNQL